MTQQDLDDSRFNIIREQVVCPLCEADQPRQKYRVDTRRVQLSSLWVDGQEIILDEIETIVECQQCGLVYVNPRLVEMPGVATYNTELESAYFETTRPGRRRAFERLLVQIPKWLEYPPRTLLDFGCGDGLLIEVARQTAIEAAGLEVSPALVSDLRGRFGDQAVIDGNHATLPVNYFDIVTMTNVLEHLRQPVDVLVQAVSALKPGGLVLVHVPNLAGLPARIQKARWRQIEPYAHFTYFTPRTLAAMLKKAGAVPLGRFSLNVGTGWRGFIQHWQDRFGIHLDNGLGMVARRPFDQKADRV